MHSIEHPHNTVGGPAPLRWVSVRGPCTENGPKMASLKPLEGPWRALLATTNSWSLEGGSIIVQKAPMPTFLVFVWYSCTQMGCLILPRVPSGLCSIRLFWFLCWFVVSSAGALGGVLGQGYVALVSLLVYWSSVLRPCLVPTAMKAG